VRQSLLLYIKIVFWLALNDKRCIISLGAVLLENTAMDDQAKLMMTAETIVINAVLMNKRRLGYDGK